MYKKAKQQKNLVPIQTLSLEDDAFNFRDFSGVHCIIDCASCKEKKPFVDWAGDFHKYNVYICLYCLYGNLTHEIIFVV